MELEDFLEDVEMGVYCTAYNVFMSKTIEKGTHCTHLFYDRPVIVWHKPLFLLSLNWQNWWLVQNASASDLSYFLRLLSQITFPEYMPS